MTRAAPRSGGRRRPRAGRGAAGRRGSRRSAAAARRGSPGRAARPRRAGATCRSPRSSASTRTQRSFSRSVSTVRAGRARPCPGPRRAGRRAWPAGRGRGGVSAEGAWKVRTKKARSWNAMSSIGVTGNRTSSGGLGRRERPGRRAGRDGSWLGLRRTTRLKWANPRSWAVGQGAADRAVGRVPVGADDDHGRELLDRPAERLLPLAAAPACSAHHASAAAPRSSPPSTSSRPCASTATDQAVERQVGPRQRRRRDRQPDRLRRPLEPRPEVDQHHEERDELKHHVEQRGQVRVHMRRSFPTSGAMEPPGRQSRSVPRGFQVASAHGRAWSAGAGPIAPGTRPRRPAGGGRGRRARTAPGATRPPARPRARAGRSGCGSRA